MGRRAARARAAAQPAPAAPCAVPRPAAKPPVCARPAPAAPAEDPGALRLLLRSGLAAREARG